MKQLIMVADMEGASGIFEQNLSWNWNGGDEWRSFGRDCITSDALAVINAAIDYGIDDILLYDMHWAGDAEFNIILEKLPPVVRVFDVRDRCLDWRRIRGQASQDPFGIITIGQHARFTEKPLLNYCSDDAYFPHTIQSPPIKNLFVNGLHIAEIGTSVLSFQGVPYLANVGCAASMCEALELSDNIVQIPVKDKTKNWTPSAEETYPLIYEGTLNALRQAQIAKSVNLAPPYVFSMELCEGYIFDTSEAISWKGSVGKTRAEWEAPSVEIGLELFHYVRELLQKTICGE
ncbi:MAG: M55 family metallopeptidase [Oscillospiraceae bacterium]|nr:M55 family metallopeptidase [Oscillospiraceae bacterium]